MAAEPAIMIISQQQQYTNREIEQKEEMDIQTNIVYLNDIPNPDMREGHNDTDNNNNNDILTKKICCGMMTIMIGLIIAIIGFLWVIDPTPYTDCQGRAESRCEDGGHDIPSRTDRVNGADGADLNEFALGLLLFGVVVTIIGSCICYKGSKQNN
eukprot:CAMPEP_0201564918 /NCGR_PEP_ID=MMETSP0190_2-20130828/3636_1 /ASSEMBLY_ACC=CAM_ASM_000263 /TAXON_ID=37353 /ORGANISM="Rosalina sp." /LENGTH=154 /DNA_ID=CAMNT_0047981751 /DNA_START=32 /DNA_END=496 /DNA_ORIENTATION=-